MIKDIVLTIIGIFGIFLLIIGLLIWCTRVLSRRPEGSEFFICFSCPRFTDSDKFESKKE